MSPQLKRSVLVVLLAALLVFAVAFITLSSRADDDDNDTDFYRDSWEVLGVDAGFGP